MIQRCMLFQLGKIVRKSCWINNLKSTEQTNNIRRWIISVCHQKQWFIHYKSPQENGIFLMMGDCKYGKFQTSWCRGCVRLYAALCVLYQHSAQFVFVWNSSALACLWFWAFAWVLPKAAILYWLWLKETPKNLTVKTHLNWLLLDGAISSSGRWHVRFSLWVWC